MEMEMRYSGAPLPSAGAGGGYGRRRALVGPQETNMLGGLLNAPQKAVVVYSTVSALSSGSGASRQQRNAALLSSTVDVVTAKEEASTSGAPNDTPVNAAPSSPRDSAAAGPSQATLSWARRG